MSSLTVTERTKLEKLFDMSSGYVSNFSDTTFEHFFADEVGVEIHSEKYSTNALPRNPLPPARMVFLLMLVLLGCKSSARAPAIHARCCA